MTGIDVGSLMLAAATDARPAAFVRWDVPGGDSPAEQAATGYVMAVNLVLRAAAMDCEIAWEKRQKIYAAEIARLQAADATADPEVVEQFTSEQLRGELNDRYRADLSATAQEGYGRVVELITALRSDDHRLARAEVLERVGTAVDAINALTQRLFDMDRPGATVQEFLATRNLDTTVPG